MSLVNDIKREPLKSVGASLPTLSLPLLEPKKPSGTPERRIDVLFIAGEGRSGSTVFEQLLATDDSVVALGEVRHLWERGYASNWRCGCGSPFRECEFWAALDRTAFSGLTPPAARRMYELSHRSAGVRAWLEAALLGRRQPSHDGSAGEYLQALQSLYNATVEISGRSIIVDSSKDGSHALLLSQLPNVRLHVVHMVRDARAVAYSWAQPKRRTEVEKCMPTFSPARTAVKWWYRNMLASALKRVADSYCVIRYEDFVSHPADAINSVRARVGLNPTAGPWRPEEPISVPVVHSISGNPDRVNCRSVTLRLDDRWQKSMSRFDRTRVTAIAAPLMWRYGYFARCTPRPQAGVAEAKSHPACSTVTASAKSLESATT